jgi:hypothetical protein
VSVVGHHDPRVQLVALTLKETNCVGDKIGESGVAEITDAVTGIEVFVHAIRIPTEEFVLLMPGQGALRGERMLEDGVALLFEPEKDFFGKCPGLPKRDEIRATLSL